MGPLGLKVLGIPGRTGVSVLERRWACVPPCTHTELQPGPATAMKKMSSALVGRMK